MPRPDLTRTEECIEKEGKERELYVLRKQKKQLEKNIVDFKRIISELERQNKLVEL